MEENRRAINNIRSLAMALLGGTSKLSEELHVSRGHVSDVLNGKDPLSMEFLSKVAHFFGVPPEALQNDDFSDVSFVDPARFSLHIYDLLPVFESDKAFSILNFFQAIGVHRRLFDAERELKSFGDEESKRLLDECLVCYEKVINLENVPLEAFANMVSLMFYIVLLARGSEIVLKYVFHEERYPVIVELMKENNPKIKKLVETMEDNAEEFDDGTPFQNLIHDAGVEEELNSYLRELKESEKWSDLADYYVCLQYVLACVDNGFSLERNHRFGLGLMSKFGALGNKYALRYLSIMG